MGAVESGSAVVSLKLYVLYCHCTIHYGWFGWGFFFQAARLREKQLTTMTALKEQRSSFFEVCDKRLPKNPSNVCTYLAFQSLLTPGHTRSRFNRKPNTLHPIPFTFTNCYCSSYLPCISPALYDPSLVNLALILCTLHFFYFYFFPLPSTSTPSDRACPASVRSPVSSVVRKPTLVRPSK